MWQVVIAVSSPEAYEGCSMQKKILIFSIKEIYIWRFIRYILELHCVHMTPGTILYILISYIELLCAYNLLDQSFIITVLNSAQYFFIRFSILLVQNPRSLGPYTAHHTVRILNIIYQPIKLYQERWLSLTEYTCG